MSNVKAYQFVFFLGTLFFSKPLLLSNPFLTLGDFLPNNVHYLGDSTPPSHEVFDGLLQKYVTATGKVNYSGFLNDISLLNGYIKRMTEVGPAEGWSRDEKLAYWINLYNAVTIRLVCTYYPVGSIKEIDEGHAWDVKRVTVGGTRYSLKDVEQNVLEAMGEPRIHFAISHAAQSCPPIWNHAWTAGNVQTQLAVQTNRFINGSAFNKIKSGKVMLSPIFQWSAKDFGDLIGFLNQYSSTSIRKGAEIQFLEYDWRLNEAM